MTTQPGLGQNQTGAGVWRHGVGMGSLTAPAHLPHNPCSLCQLFLVLQG